MTPKKKIKFKLIFIIICILLVIILYNIILYGKRINDPIKKMMRQAELISVTQNAKGTTYYVSSTGTSKNGTNINDPMSLETANTKTFFGGDQVLFKRGDTFFGIINFTVSSSEDKMFYIGAYGNETNEKPVITTSINTNEEKAWKEISDNIYCIDLSNREYIKGYNSSSSQLYNIGFFRDENNKIYGNKKSSINELNNEFDFYCEGKNFYVKMYENPIKKLGKITFSNNNSIVFLSSYTILDGLIIKDGRCTWNC